MKKPCAHSNAHHALKMCTINSGNFSAIGLPWCYKKCQSGAVCRLDICTPTHANVFFSGLELYAFNMPVSLDKYASTVEEVGSAVTNTKLSLSSTNGLFPLLTQKPHSCSKQLRRKAQPCRAPPAAQKACSYSLGRGGEKVLFFLSI